MSKYTIDQKRAIYEPSTKNILVSAGAGSGKTTVLTERIIQKELKGERLENLIILTFTNAASNNMRKKIKNALLEKYEETKDINFKNEADYIDQANISTFDSFMARLFTKYAYTINMSGEINIREKNASEFLYLDILNAVFNQFSDDPRFIELEKTYTIRSRDELLSPILSLYLRKVSNTINPIDKFKKFLSNYDANYDKFINLMEENYKNNLPLLLKALDEANPSQAAYNMIKASIDPLLNTNSISEYISANKEYKSVTKRSKLIKEDEGACLAIDNIKAIKERMDDLIPVNIDSLDDLKDLYMQNKALVSVIFDILERFMDEYDSYIREFNSFTYNDIAKLVLEILKTNKNVLQEIKDNTKEILVDEYQDTSNIQEELISLISNNNCFMVGDIKQSIYRFRDANPDIFRYKFDLYGKDNTKGVRIDLLENFRSTDKVINDINKFFSPLMTLDFGGIDYEASHKFKIGNKDSKTIGEGIEFYNITKDPEIGKKENQLNEFKNVLADILYRMENEIIITKDGKRKPEFKDFAILTRNKNNYKDYNDICKSLNIPIISEANEAFVRNDEMATLRDILIQIDKPSDKLSYYSILRSFIYEANDDYILDLEINNEPDKDLSEKLDSLRLIKNSVNIYDLLSKIYDTFNFYQNLSKLNDPMGAEKRLLYMLTLAKNSATTGMTFDEFIIYLDKLNQTVKNKELDIADFQTNEIRNENSISLMTIHKSKGLEYPYIYFIETDTIVGKSDNLTFLLDDEYGLVLNTNNDLNIFYKLVSNKSILETLYEDFRLFYVCVTRAMHKVIIFGYDLDEGDSNTYNLSIDKEIKYNYKSYNDIIKSVLQTVNPTSIKPLKKYENSDNNDNKDDRSKSITFKSIKPFKNVNNGARPSISASTILSKEEKDNIDYGIHIHELLHYIDFNNPNFKDISESDEKRITSFIDNVIKNKSIVKDEIVKFYKEHELYCDYTIGAIDLIIETKSEYIIIDYKTKNIDKDGYKRQVKVYMSALKNLTNNSKTIKGYLYSIIDQVIEEVK